MTNFAIIRAGSKQYQVAVGDVLDIDLREEEKGSKIEFKDVLFLQNEKGSQVGFPSVAQAIVKAEVLEHSRGPKVFAYKYKLRQRSTRRKVGHRQHYTRVRITEV